MKKILLALPLLLLFPIAAQAAWWNPLTWSWSATQATSSIQQGTPDVDIPTVTDTELPPEEASTPTVQIRYVTDPNLSIQVQELQKENEALDDQIASLQSDKMTLSTQLSLCTATLTTKSAPAAASPSSDGIGGVEVNGVILSPCDQAKAGLKAANLVVFDTNTGYSNMQIQLQAEGASVADKDALYGQYYTQDFTDAQNEVKAETAKIAQYCTN